MKFRPSPQQQAIFDWAANGQGSCIIEAVAGAGKTTTLIKMLKYLKGSTFLGAFNKKIAMELQDRIELEGLDVRFNKAGTMHSAGFGSIRKNFGKVQVDDNKIRNIIEELKLHRDWDFIQDSDSFLKKVVGLAKQKALGVFGRIDDMSEWYSIIDHFGLEEDLPEYSPDIRDLIAAAQEILYRSIDRVQHVIDFDDMVYGPLIHNLPMYRNNNVLIDEAQDTNEARRALARKMLQPGGRLIAVGDPHQAIYGFTGADADSLEKISRDFNAIHLPLTVTYRCPKKVVELAKTWVSHIEAHESAPDGSLMEMNTADFLKRKDFDRNHVVLCRYTKPLIEMAYGFIRNRVPVVVEGRDIGKGLIRLATRWKVRDLDALEKRLEEYKRREIEKWVAKGNEMKAEQIADRCETLRIMIEELSEDGKTKVDDLVNFIEGLFGDAGKDNRNCLTLSTIHKAKGLEWRNVYWLKRAELQPSKWARKDWELGQEYNLMYVAATRSKSVLVDLV